MAQGARTARRGVRVYHDDKLDMLSRFLELAGHLKRDQTTVTVAAEDVWPVRPRPAHGLDSARRDRFQCCRALRLVEAVEMHGVERAV